MHNNHVYIRYINARKFFVLASTATVILLLVFPVRLLLGALYYSRSARILNNDTTEEHDIPGFSAVSAVPYEGAIAKLEDATTIAPFKSMYRKTFADIYFKTALWVQTMQRMEKPLAAGMSSSRDYLERAVTYLEQAILLEPTNPDYHLALGRLYGEKDRNFEGADREYQLAVRLYPVNANIRYAVAIEYLLKSQPEKTIIQAKELAGFDETYRLDSDNPAELLAREKRSSWYLARLVRSYLFKSMEIVWRASGKDAAKVAAIVPDNVDAREASRLFFELKGIEYDDEADK